MQIPVFFIAELYIVQIIILFRSRSDSYAPFLFTDKFIFKFKNSVFGIKFKFLILISVKREFIVYRYIVNFHRAYRDIIFNLINKI